jgi:hypothetical protein
MHMHTHAQDIAIYDKLLRSSHPVKIILSHTEEEEEHLDKYCPMGRTMCSQEGFIWDRNESWSHKMAKWISSS